MSVREEWNMACPKCGRDDRVEIAASIMVRLVQDGTDADLARDSAHEWDGESPALCSACDFTGKVKDFELHPHPFATEERDTILAALRFWQALKDGKIDYFGAGKGEYPRLDELETIATCDGEHAGLDAEDIDELCERLNV